MIQDFLTVKVVVESNNGMECTLCTERKYDLLEQNRHYFWNQLPRISKKEVLDFYQEKCCRAVEPSRLSEKHYCSK